MHICEITHYTSSTKSIDGHLTRQDAYVRRHYKSSDLLDAAGNYKEDRRIRVIMVAGWRRDGDSTFVAQPIVLYI